MDEEVSRLSLLLFCWFSLLGVVRGTCPAEFRGRCVCGEGSYNDQSSRVTNCTNAGLDVGVLVEVPVDVEVLVFVGNRLRSLPEKLFGSVGVYKELRVVDLSRNEIEWIDENAFSDAQSSVQTLILDDNSWIPDKRIDVFAELRKLRRLHLANAFGGKNRLRLISALVTASRDSLEGLHFIDLSRNELESIDDDSFLCFLPELRTLNLSSNFITSLVFTPRCVPTRLAVLDLSGNEFVALDASTRQQFDALNDTQIILLRNRFVCDCKLNDTIFWLEKTRSDVIPPQTCGSASPRHLVGHSIESLRLEQLNCVSDNDGFRKQDVSGGLVALLVTLSLCFVVLVAVLVAKRVEVGSCLQRTSEPFRKKFQYSTINSRKDEVEVDV